MKKNICKPLFVTIVLSLYAHHIALAQIQYELNSGWRCKNIEEVKEDGVALSQASYRIQDWLPATVPGTVLTTLLNNKRIPDPLYGMNNEKIPDIYTTGREKYTYWFATDFVESSSLSGDQVWLHLRGVNYSCDIFLNGKKLNSAMHKGMFLRQSYNITSHLSATGNNRIAVIVYPPDPVGNPNGGQGGDGMIAKNVSHQYVAGWDWIQPIRDRNTGIWDKVFIEKTKAINLKNPHIVTKVSGKRFPEGKQEPATLKVTTELENPTAKSVSGIVSYTWEGTTISQKVTVAPFSTTTAALPDYTIKNPRLWWPNGYGEQHLYTLKLQVLINGKILSDEENILVGVREIQTKWNNETRSRQVMVNGQRIFIKGGNWIISDAMLRFTDARYDAEIRFHRDMNLNLIRIWGGALIERPEFYSACDKYGLLVMQDFWMSGDCNGRWTDPKKTEDQWTRRKYPDDHALFLTSAMDQIKMIRNHASLGMWCGGNEITPPEDILTPLRDSIIPKLDGTRWFVEYSNSDSMSFNSIGGNGDGPYGIQPIESFWDKQTFPFNSEVGSVGIGDYESLERFIPAENMVAPKYPGKVDPVWDYHKYIGYDQYISPYGEPKNVKDFAAKAQLVNYDQYRALMEGFSSHMWEWYTGTIIWKTQNPWTAMRGQMYDYYLDPNACLYGLRHGSEPLHVMYSPTDGMVMIANNTVKAYQDLMLVIKTYDMNGKDSLLSQVFVGIEPTISKKYLALKGMLNSLRKDKGVFLSLQLLDLNKQILSENFYWLPDNNGMHTGLNQMKAAKIQAEAKWLAEGKIELKLSNFSESPVAFFNRISLIDPKSKKRLLPVFYSDNYISITPGSQKTIYLEYHPENDKATPLISISGWNVEEHLTEISK
jgi:hypothetical protein